jgi:hypothetical protein
MEGPSDGNEAIWLASTEESGCIIVELLVVVGADVGSMDGLWEGPSDGIVVGASVGSCEGVNEGISDGNSIGADVGISVGLREGGGVGDPEVGDGLVGLSDGRTEGIVLGPLDGLLVVGAEVVGCMVEFVFVDAEFSEAESLRSLNPDVVTIGTGVELAVGESDGTTIPDSLLLGGPEGDCETIVFDESFVASGEDCCKSSVESSSVFVDG